MILVSFSSGGDKAADYGFGRYGLAEDRGRRIHGRGGQAVAGREGQVEGGERGEDVLVHCGGAEGWMPV